MTDQETFIKFLHALYLHAFQSFDQTVSVSLLCGPTQQVLRQCRQIFSQKSVAYQNCLLALDQNDTRRALLGLVNLLGPLTDPVHQQLLRNVIYLYDRQPVDYEKISVFKIFPCGSLKQLDQTYDVHQLPRQTYQLPPFWRWLHALTQSMLLTQTATLQDLLYMVEKVAQPLTVAACITTRPCVPLPNLIRYLSTAQILASTVRAEDVSANNLLTSISMRRMVLLQDTQGIQVMDAPYVHDWAQKIAPYSLSLNSTNLLMQTLQQLTVRSTVKPSEDPTQCLAIQSVKASLFALEAAKDKTVTDEDDDEVDEEPDNHHESDEDASGDSVDSTHMSADPSTGEETDPPSDASLDDPTKIDNNSMSGAQNAKDKDTIIPFNGEDDQSTNAYLFRQAVCALNDALDRDPDLSVTMTSRSVLADWCKSWLWLTPVSKTQDLLRDLKLIDLVKPVKKIQ